MKKDAFYCDLTFGTGGLRGIIGAGTNRMNKYVVGKASQGLASYLLSKEVFPSVVIGYDSRLKSDVFAKEAAKVFAANGIRVHIWPTITPVPTVSYAVRYLKTSAGVMITASHNPSEYNGYKVYDSDGCQITTETALGILNEIEKIDIFSDVKEISWEVAISQGIIELIEGKVLDGYITEVKQQSVLYGDDINRDITIVYSPLNGTGLVPVTRVLKESGFTNIHIVEEQKSPDGNFPTCPKPNPELRESMQLGIQYCEKIGADLLLATDPDCDRCGVVVKHGDDYRFLTANEVGLILLDYICSQRKIHNKMPDSPVFIKTIVTTDMSKKIANYYGAETIDVLTGFKYVGEKLCAMEKLGRVDDYIFGFEESCGYLTGPYVRDKDGVNAVFMICEMLAFYKTRGISLIEKLNEIYTTFGYCLDTSYSYEFFGDEGRDKIISIMEHFRKGLNDIAEEKVIHTEDYILGINRLPKSNVLRFFTNNTSVTIRPSGTEPKLKVYISVTSDSKIRSEKIEKTIVADIEKRLM